MTMEMKYSMRYIFIFRYVNYEIYTCFENNIDNIILRNLETLKMIDTFDINYKLVLLLFRFIKII